MCLLHIDDRAIPFTLSTMAGSDHPPKDVSISLQKSLAQIHHVLVAQFLLAYAD
jgi:hypothetical protein